MSQFTSKDRQGFVILGIVGAIFIGLFALFVASTQKEILDDRLCPKDVLNKTVFLVDRSDDTPTQTVSEINRRINIIVDKDVQQGELVALFYITDGMQKDLKPAFESCKPQTKVNELYENKRIVEKNFANKFDKPFKTALENQPTGAGSSPIVETLTDFAASDYLDGKHNRLVVFSDLMQNSETLNLYECSKKEDAIAAYRQSSAGELKLDDVEVRLNIIPRRGLGPVTKRCRDGFWRWLFKNGSQLDVRYLPG